MGYACGITRQARVEIHFHVKQARAFLSVANRQLALESLDAMWALLPEGTYDDWDAVDDAARVEGVLRGGEPLDEEDTREARAAGFNLASEAGVMAYLASTLEELEDDAANFEAAEAYCSIAG